MSKVALWKKKMDEYYAQANDVELYIDLKDAGFMNAGASHPAQDIFSPLSEVAVAAQSQDNEQDSESAVAYVI